MPGSAARLALVTLLAVTATACASAASTPPRPADAPSGTTSSSAPTVAERSSSRRFHAQVLDRVPTDQADARGLEQVGDLLVENTGVSNRSVTPATGDIRAQRELAPHAAGTGIALTPAGLWQGAPGSLVLRDPVTFAERRREAPSHQSWGLCHDGTRLVQSEGTTRLLLRDRDTAALVGEVRLATREWATARLGELHCLTVKGYPQVWAAVTGTDWMIRIDLSTGVVTAVADLTAVTVAEQPTGAHQVIGGIAAVAGAEDQLWLTGRHYRHRYRIWLPPP